MGSAMGEDPEILEEVCGWVMEVAKRPVWVKMTPNITHIEAPTRASLRAGCQGISAINTIRSVLGVDLETLRPEPSVEGYTTLGGYSCQAIRPIALRICMEVAQVIRDEFRGRTLSGIGGVETGDDAAQFLLLGCDTVQVCTGVMKFGYGIIHEIEDQLLAFMEKHNFERIEDFKGHSLQYFTTHAELVERQAAAREAKKAEAHRKAIRADADWDGEDFVKQSDALARG
jgi:dihydropyrimidine dehydrogenase (NADP+)/dihydropyrimidine dehydrogenase (NAD+) subunit PreA